MANIRDIAASSDKWSRRASVAGPDYEAGVRNPRRSWSEGAAAADGNYKAGITASLASGAFKKGVQAAGEQRWSEKTIAKGPSRFAEGVAISKGDWEAGFAPFQRTIAALNLPPRGPKGSPQNLNRVATVANALRAVSQGKGGS